MKSQQVDPLERDLAAKYERELVEQGVEVIHADVEELRQFMLVPPSQWSADDWTMTTFIDGKKRTFHVRPVPMN